MPHSWSAPLAEVLRRGVTVARSARGWWTMLSLFVTGLAACLWLPARPGSPDPTDPLALATYVTLGTGVLLVLFARNWERRVGVVFGGLLTSVCAVTAAQRLECSVPYSRLPVCDRLYDVHLLVLVSLALGLMLFLYLAIDPTTASQ